MDEDTRLFYEELGYSAPPVPKGGGVLAEAAPAEADVGERPLLGKEEVVAIKERFIENPDEILQWFQENWGDDVTEEDVWDALMEAELALGAPIAATASRKSLAFFFEQLTLPDNFTFEGMTDEIPIDPGSKKFETKGDALGWILFSGPQFVGDKIHIVKKAPLRQHDDFPTNFVYELGELPAGDSLEIALFSDFGTGLYHSQYIARQLQQRKFPYAIHLGDVYYAGRRSEFRKHFEGPLDPLLSNTALYTMNANHEMLSGGFPYFDYIDKRRGINPELQKQEGSYFCLRSEQFQVVGIDTAYHEVGRFREAELLSWLKEVFSNGRDMGVTNILLSPDEPYGYGQIGLRNLLTQDLHSIVLEDELVDLWFWGNTHYCALFDRAEGLPFIGSCIGHGGYPYTRKRPFQTSPAPVAFLETTARFPTWTDIRQDRGNNGYCILNLKGDGSVELVYMDWMGNRRCIAQLAPDAQGKLSINSVTDLPEPPEPV